MCLESNEWLVVRIFVVDDGKFDVLFRVICRVLESFD